MNDWISVKEQMPKTFHTVLLTDGIDVGAGEYRGTTNLGFPYWSGSLGECVNITHWMPLPKPPKEEQP